MQIRFTATSQDVGALLRYSLHHSRQLWIRLGGILLFFPAVLALEAVAAGRRVTSLDVAVGLLIGTIGALGSVWAVFGRNKDAQRTVTIGPEGIQTSLGRRSDTIPWTGVEFVGETQEHIFIASKSGDTFAVPSQAFASGTERAEFLDRLAEYSRAAI